MAPDEILSGRICEDVDGSRFKVGYVDHQRRVVICQRHRVVPGLDACGYGLDQEISLDIFAARARTCVPS